MYEIYGGWRFSVKELKAHELFLNELEKDNMSKVFADVETFLKAVGQTVPLHPRSINDQAKLYLKLMLEENTEFWEAFIVDDPEEQIDACFDMIWVIVGYMKSRGWDCNAIWDEGAKSNLAKISPETGLVIRREDGKILKPEGWKEPDFSQFV